MKSEDDNADIKEEELIELIKQGRANHRKDPTKDRQMVDERETKAFTPPAEGQAVVTAGKRRQ